jgi:hypothetical protein
MSQQTPDKNRFEQLLPFYLNGSLADEDKAFVENFLSLHPEANDSVEFTRHLKDTVRHLAPAQPDEQQVKRMAQRWAVEKGFVTENANNNKPSSGRGWHFGIFAAFTALGAAAVGAALMFSISPIQLGLLHNDDHDGLADLELILASGITPDHEIIVAHFQKFNAVIVSHTEQDGRHRVSVDLKSRATHQYALIQTLQTSGHLQGYTLVASR